MAAAEELVRKTISLAPDVYEKALVLAAQRGFKKSFSAYCAWLIERDHERRAAAKAPAATPTLRVAEEEPGEDGGGAEGGEPKKIGFTSKARKGAVLLVPPNQWDGDHPQVMPLDGEESPRGEQMRR